MRARIREIENAHCRMVLKKNCVKARKAAPMLALQPSMQFEDKNRMDV
jgi:hypothetical protein